VKPYPLTIEVTLVRVVRVFSLLKWDIIRVFHDLIRVNEKHGGSNFVDRTKHGRKTSQVLVPWLYGELVVLLLLVMLNHLLKQFGRNLLGVDIALLLVLRPGLLVQLHNELLGLGLLTKPLRSDVTITIRSDFTLKDNKFFSK